MVNSQHTINIIIIIIFIIRTYFDIICRNTVPKFIKYVNIVAFPCRRVVDAKFRAGVTSIENKIQNLPWGKLLIEKASSKELLVNITDTPSNKGGEPIINNIHIIDKFYIIDISNIHYKGKISDV